MLISNLKAKYQRKEAFSQGRCTTQSQHFHQGPGYELFTSPCSRISRVKDPMCTGGRETDPCSADKACISQLVLMVLLAVLKNMPGK